MTFKASRGLLASALALAFGLGLPGVAGAQTNGAPPPNAGLVMGEVAHCVNGAEQPTAQVSVGIEGGGAALARTDANGQFVLALPPGTYNVVATASDGTASRQYVPVETGQALDIGILDIGGGVAGCGPDSDITAPVLPTFTSTSTPIPDPPTPTSAPTAQPSPAATPIPDDTPDQDSGG